MTSLRRDAKPPPLPMCITIIKLSDLHIRKPSVDVLPSKNQALCEYCIHVSNY